MLRALLESYGADVRDFGIVPDDLAAIQSAVDGARHHVVIFTIGGASVGDLDLVKPALDAAGARLDFITVALKPGKRAEERRVGEEGGRKCRNRRATSIKKKNQRT